MKTHEDYVEEFQKTLVASYQHQLDRASAILQEYKDKYPLALAALEDLVILELNSKVLYWLGDYGTLDSSELKLFFSYLDDVLGDCPEDLPILIVDESIQAWKRQLFAHALERIHKEA
jgi:hypothetical protein